MSQAEHPERLQRNVTVDDIRQLVGAATPHFALQIRNRVARLIDGLPEDDPARRVGEEEIERLTQLAFTGETRGRAAEPGMRPLASVSEPGEEDAAEDEGSEEEPELQATSATGS
jgi:hypothetical protein